MSALLVLLVTLAGADPSEPVDVRTSLDPEAYQLRIDGFEARSRAPVLDPRLAAVPIRIQRPMQSYAGTDHPMTIGGTFMWVFGGMATLGCGIAWGITGGRWSRAGRDTGRVLLISVPVTVGGAFMFDRGMRIQRGNLHPKDKTKGPIYVWHDPMAREVLPPMVPEAGT